MASERLVFGTHAESIQHLFSDANIALQNELYQDLLRFLSKACGYEEEERKIRPSIIIGHNLQDSSLQRILQSTLIPLVKDRMDSTHLSKRLKSTLPFCNNGWRVYIDIGDECITYGIMRNFNGPTGVNIEEILCGLSDDELLAMNVHFILIDIVSNYEVLLKGNGRECMIDFRLITDATEVNANAVFCQDILSACESERSKASVAYSKIVKLFSQKLHGCICVIIKHDYELPDTVLKDGIFLENPIDICSILTDELNDKQLMYDVSSVISAHEKYHAFTGLLIEMMNIDGITVVDNKGRIRAYNVFVKPDAEGIDALSGGARKRAAAYLGQLNNPNYIGVYFQSQDGMSSYERMGSHE